MKRPAKRWTLGVSFAALLGACGGETEGKIVPLMIAVEPRGDDGAALGEFTTQSGWHVQLTEARLGIGALYLYAQREGERSAVAQLLDLLVPVARAHGGFDPLNGEPVRAEYREPVALDFMGDRPQALGEVGAEEGEASGLSLQLLGPGDELPEGLHGHSAWVVGEAERQGTIVRFEGGIDLEDEGAIRRVESIESEVTIRAGQLLLLHVNPKRWLSEADFSRLAPPIGEDEPSTITAEDQVGRAWHVGVRNPAAYSVEIVEGDQP